MNFNIFPVVFLSAMLLSNSTMADQVEFSKGPLILKYGPVAPVPGATTIPADVRFNIAFDITDRAKAGSVNRRIESAARFLNMHVAAGVDPGNINLAVVIHGQAVFDVVSNEKHGGDNSNAELIKILQENGVSFQVCGQSAAYHGVSKADLLPGVEMALSAMTANAILQQQGYTLNP